MLTQDAHSSILQTPLKTLPNSTVSFPFAPPAQADFHVQSSTVQDDTLAPGLDEKAQAVNRWAASPPVSVVYTRLSVNPHCQARAAEESFNVPEVRRWFKRTIFDDSRVLQHVLGEFYTRFTRKMIELGGKGQENIFCNHTQYEEESTLSIRPANWLKWLGVTCGLRLSLASLSNRGWRYTLETFRPVPDDSLIFEFCQLGNLHGVTTLLSRGLASVKDTDSKGHTALHVGTTIKLPF